MSTAGPDISRDAPTHAAEPWLSIVGIGEDGLTGLSAAARRVVDAAEVFAGGDRHLAMLPPDDRPRLPWPSPLPALVDAILNRRGRRVCVLATGDPLWYGVGVTLAKRLPRAEYRIFPHLSAFQLAAARMGWALAETEALTLHGRPLELLAPYLYPGARVLLLSDGATTPGAVASLLRARGLGSAAMTVFEHMGGARESSTTKLAVDWDAEIVTPFNTVALELPDIVPAMAASRAAGLPDDAFAHDGRMTKREVRAATLAALAPWPGALLWDVGAGCGSVAIEWMRMHPRNRAIAIERKPDRIALMRENAAALGTPLLRIVTGHAPTGLRGLEAPDAVFIGGGLDAPALFECCWEALRPGGRLVANTVTLESEAQLLTLRRDRGGTLRRIAVARAEPVGPHTGWRPLMPVTQWEVVKKASGEVA